MNAPDFEALAGSHLAQVSIFEQSVLVEFVLHVSQCELCAPHRHVEFGENPGQSANVIFMAVGENDAAHPLPILDEVRNVGNNDVHAEQFGFGEHQSGIDHNNIVAPTDGHAVHTELAKAPQGDDLQFSSWHGVVLMLARVCQVAYRAILPFLPDGGWNSVAF